MARRYHYRRVGSFCYVRDIESGEFWSVGFHPTGREVDHYEVTFAPDRAVLRRRDEGIETHIEITVSPEDDAEIRRVSLTNHPVRRASWSSPVTPRWCWPRKART